MHVGQSQCRSVWKQAFVCGDFQKWTLTQGQTKRSFPWVQRASQVYGFGVTSSLLSPYGAVPPAVPWHLGRWGRDQ